MVSVIAALVVTGASCSSEPEIRPELRQQAAASADGPTVTIALPRPAATRTLLVAAVTWEGSDDLRVDGGAGSWAATGPSVALGAARTQLAYAISDAPGPVTVSAPGGAAVRVALREYTGVDTSAPFLAGSRSATPPTADREGGGLLVSAQASPDRPVDVRDIGVDLSRRPSALATDEAGSATLTALFRGGRASAPTRDPLRQPFAASSIWNTAIGSSARYVPARLPAVPGGDRFAPMPQNDETSILQTPDAPMTDLRYSSAGWTGRSRCAATGSREFYRVPMPRSYTVDTSTHNEGASWLMPDGRTINQSGPLARCESGGYATSIDTSEPIDIYGDGISRSLGGSGLSGVVGALRRGEMRPTTDGTGVRHALRVNVDTDRQIAACDTDAACYRWPASSADRDAVSAYGRRGTDAPAAMRLGALLAIAPTVDVGALGLQTEPGRQLAWTLQNYGAYVADSTACACFAIVTEKGPDGDFASQFEKDYGFDFAARVADDTPWTRDLQKVQGVLSVVDNNAPSSVGGGGFPLQPAAAPIAP